MMLLFSARGGERTAKRGSAWWLVWIHLDEGISAGSKPGRREDGGCKKMEKGDGDEEIVEGGEGEK